jgi:hypothetical protein
METSDSLRRLFEFIANLRMECAFQDSTELLNLVSLEKIGAQNPSAPMSSSKVNYVTPRTKTKHWPRLFVQAMEFFRSRVDTERPRWPWP